MTATSCTWQSLPDPFLLPDASRVSGRGADIKNLITRRQSAILLTGAPNIGKTTLMRYLQAPPSAAFSWRQEDELTALNELLSLGHLYFVPVGLVPLEQAQSHKEMLESFVVACARAIQEVYPPNQQSTEAEGGVGGLRDVLRVVKQVYFQERHAELRIFVMLDAIERLGRFARLADELGLREESSARDLGLALLTECGAIRLLVDLIDEFSQFGAILSINSLPRPVISRQFSQPAKPRPSERHASAERHVSADLARFTTMQLPILSRGDAQAFLAQPPQAFGPAWAAMFNALDGQEMFSQQEQQWILEQAGTHPYLLQQFCSHTFHLKQDHADLIQHWPQLQEEDKKLLVELVHQSVITFMTQLWERLQEALESCKQETRNTFEQFISTMAEKGTDEEIQAATLDWLGAELRYILSNEGVIRYDMLSTRQPVYYPGALLRNYLIRQVSERAAENVRGFWLTIMFPETSQRERLPLSELEYRLLKTLLQHPRRCPEEELMKGAWGQPIERPKFTQRLHHLRKKLKERTGNTDIIINHYGGLYSLNHADWLRLE